MLQLADARPLYAVRIEVIAEARMPQRSNSRPESDALSRQARCACYRVTLRGAYRRDVYFTQQTRGLLIEIVTGMVERFAGKLLGCSSTPECLQLLIRVSDEPLGRIMLRVARRYVRRVHEQMDAATAGTLPTTADIVNRLFDMRLRRLQHPDEIVGEYRSSLSNDLPAPESAGPRRIS